MDLYNHFKSPGGKGSPLIGGAIAVSDTINPDYMVHHIVGTGIISTITLPYPGFIGPLYLISDDGFSFSDSGNIALQTGTIRVGSIIPLLYDLAINKWYTTPAALIPFTLLTGLSAEVTAVLIAIDFIASVGGYSTFEISKTQGGPYTATIDFDCPELGTNTVYILGTNGSNTLELSTTIDIQDNLGHCP